MRRFTRLEPVAVAFPRSARQASALVQAAMQAGISVIPRGAGTGLVGGAIGQGLVIDFSRYNRQITDLDLERRTVRVGPGVVLDQLNNFLRPHNFCFGPDVATSARATLGGMIANNSSGAHTPAYGTTADHISELEIVLADGRIVMAGPGHDTLRPQRELVRDLAYFHALEIQERFPAGPAEALAGLRHRPLRARAGQSQSLALRQRGHAGGDHVRRIEDRPAAKGNGIGGPFSSRRWPKRCRRRWRCWI